MVAMGLAQVGEFSFILVEVGRDAGLMTGDLYQTFLMVSIVTILLTPLLISLAPRMGFQVALWTGGKGERRMVEKDGEIGRLRGHVVIVGYGLNGQNVARVLDETGLPYIVLELNADMVKKARVEGRPVCFGDATSRDILEKAGLSDARGMVVAISDPAATRRVVWQARQINPEVYIIARTRYVSEIDDLYTLGANQVIPEEFETSLEIVSRVLREYHVPRNIIVLQIDLIRRERYGMMRGLHLPARTLDQLHSILAQTTTDTVLIPDGAPAIGKTLGEMEIQMKVGVTVLAIVREGTAVTNPGPDTRVEAGDVLVLVGDHAALDRAIRFLTVED
jgi:CPA2 family monovalent cation:H+ antiporter-2